MFEVDISAQDLQFRYTTSRIHLRYNTWSLIPTLYSLRRYKKTQIQTHEPFPLPVHQDGNWQMTALADLRKFFLIGLHSRHKESHNTPKRNIPQITPSRPKCCANSAGTLAFYVVEFTKWVRQIEITSDIEGIIWHLIVHTFAFWNSKMHSVTSRNGVELTPFQTCGPQRHQLEMG